MAYVSRGFEPVSNIVTLTGRTEQFYVPSTDTTALAMYDVVKLATGADATGNNPTCTRITGVDDVPCGVVVGFVPDPAYLEQTYRSASTTRYAIVCTDPNIELMVQEDNAGAATLATTRIGLAVDPVVGSVDTATGTSGMQISSAATTGSPGMFYLQRRASTVDNALIGGTNTKWVVTFLKHHYKISA
jgi:hypothetical protein